LVKKVVIKLYIGDLEH